MKMMCHREGLLSAFQLASAAVSSQNVKPILKNLKAVVDDGRCTLMATPYLSEAWWQAVGAALKASREAGFSLCMVDEFEWPSGEARDYWRRVNAGTSHTTRTPRRLDKLR